MRLTLLLCAALSLAPVASSHAAAVVTFPGSTRQALSPDGRFAVLNMDRDEEPNHVLSLHDKKQGSRFPIFPYRRHVDVSWSKDSKFFFVNDYAESDLADCVVASVDDHKQRKMSATLQEEILDFMRGFKGSHLYVTCDAWSPNDDLAVSVWGSGDGSPKRRFLFNARSGKAVPAR